MAVLTAPDRIRKPTTTTKALSSSLSHGGPTTCIARPPMRLSEYSLHADVVGDEHHGQEADAAREDQAVDEDDERRLLEVRQLRRLDLAVDLGQRLLAAHGQDRVAERHEACRAAPIRLNQLSPGCRVRELASAERRARPGKPSRVLAASLGRRGVGRWAPVGLRFGGEVDVSGARSSCGRSGTASALAGPLHGQRQRRTSRA